MPNLQRFLTIAVAEVDAVDIVEEAMALIEVLTVAEVDTVEKVEREVNIVDEVDIGALVVMVIVGRVIAGVTAVAGEIKLSNLSSSHKPSLPRTVDFTLTPDCPS